MGVDNEIILSSDENNRARPPRRCDEADIE